MKRTRNSHKPAVAFEVKKCSQRPDALHSVNLRGSTVTVGKAPMVGPEPILRGESPDVLMEVGGESE